MFDIGFFELLMIGVVALLVFGPERLPEVARTAGRWIGQARRLVQGLKSDLERELEAENLRQLLQQQQQQIHDLKGMVDDVRVDVQDNLSKPVPSGETATADVSPTTNNQS